MIFPEILIKPLLGIGLVIGLWFGYFAWEYHIDQRGYDRAVSERATADKKKEREDAVVALKEERDAAAAETSAETKRQQKEATYEKTIADLRANARNGNSGLRCPTTRIPTNTAPEATKPGTGVGQTDGQQLVSTAADDILSIAGDIGESVSRYNSLLAAYHRLHDFCDTRTSQASQTQ